MRRVRRVKGCFLLLHHDRGGKSCKKPFTRLTRLTRVKMNNLHGIVEDLGAVIGYTATAALIDWFGGGNLYVPFETGDNSHPICKVIGSSAFARLVKEWPGELLWIPLGYQREQDRRDRMIAVLLELGLGSKAVAAIAGMSERHVQHTRYHLEELGVMPMILKKAGLATGPLKPGLQNRPAKPGLKTGLPKPGLKTGPQKSKGKRAW